MTGTPIDKCYLKMRSGDVTAKGVFAIGETEGAVTNRNRLTVSPQCPRLVAGKLMDLCCEAKQLPSSGNQTLLVGTHA